MTKMASCTQSSSSGQGSKSNPNSLERTVEILFFLEVLGIFFNSSRFINVFAIVMGDFPRI